MIHIKQSTIRAIVTGTILMLISGVASATTYYVSTTGSDSRGTGSVSSPWASITHASTVTVAGDTVIVENGTYNIPAGGSCGRAPCGDWAIGSSGSSGNPITYISQTPLGAKLVGQGTGHASTVVGMHGSYNILQGFDITGRDAAGVILATTGTPTNNQANNNYVHDLVAPCDGNGGGGLNTGGGSAYTGVSHHSFYGNFVVNITNSIGSSCRFFTLYGIYLAVPYCTAANNIVINTFIGIKSGHTATNLTIFGNTVIASGGDAGIVMGSQGTGNVNDYTVVQNNIVTGFNNYGILNDPVGGGAIGTHNSYLNNLGYKNTPSDWSIGTYICTKCLTNTNPLFVNNTGFFSGDYRVSANSPARGAGTALSGVLTDYYGVPRPQSSTTVIGAAVADMDKNGRIQLKGQGRF